MKLAAFDVGGDSQSDPAARSDSRCTDPAPALEHFCVGMAVPSTTSGGYAIINDITARDLQGRHSQWLIGKSQDSFGPMGPWAVTRHEIDLANTQVRCWVNGELRQDQNTSALIVDVPSLIATLSQGITLLPGDIIVTGTPAGEGIGFKPPKYLVPGDVMKVEISGIGILENQIHERPA